MAHFVEINENNIVTNIIVVNNNEAPNEETGLAFIKSLGLTGTWKQTSYNTRGGVHYGQDGQPDNGVALRKNYACIGHTYDSQRDAFIPPSPYPSWVIDEDTCQWIAPVLRPQSDATTGYKWDEDSKSWVAFTKTQPTA